MGNITRKIQLFNDAYAWAWEEISKGPAHRGADVAPELAILIRSKIATGSDDAAQIADEAAAALKGSPL